MIKAMKNCRKILEACKRIIYAYLFIFVVKISSFESKVFDVVSWIYFLKICVTLYHILYFTCISFMYRQYNKIMWFIIDIARGHLS